LVVDDVRKFSPSHRLLLARATSRRASSASSKGTDANVVFREWLEWPSASLEHNTLAWAGLQGTKLIESFPTVLACCASLSGSYTNILFAFTRAFAMS
jgi:hypothetical protein